MGALSRSGSMMLSMWLRNKSLCEGSGGMVSSPVMFGVFGRSVVFASLQHFYKML